MPRERRSSGQPPRGSDPRDPWREYADEAGIPDDPDGTDDDLDVDPSDGRPLPRRRRRGGRVARALAWTGGAALLMVAGGIIALAAWPRPSGPAATVATTAAEPDVATAPAGAMPGEAADANEGEGGDEPRTPAAATRADEPVPAGPTARLSPPPLPPLPPDLEPATSPAASPTEAAVPAPAPRPAQPDATPPAGARRAASPPAPLPPRDTRSSEEIMADFLVSSGDRAQAEATARAHAEWYAAGSAERTYWLGVLGAIRARP